MTLHNTKLLPLNFSFLINEISVLRFSLKFECFFFCVYLYLILAYGLTCNSPELAPFVANCPFKLLVGHCSGDCSCFLLQ